MNNHKKKIYIIIVAFIIIVIGVITTMEISRPRHEIIDFFIDSNAGGRICFFFIEVNKYDEEYMAGVSEGLMKKYSSVNSGKDSAMADSSMVIIMAHFYDLDDTAEPDEKMAARLRKLYPDKKGLTDKLNYIENGYIYTGFSRAIPGMKLPEVPLLQGPFFVPKPGVKAKDVLRQKKYFFGNDKKKINFPGSANGLIE